jgi:hypothetical protein
VKPLKNFKILTKVRYKPQTSRYDQEKEDEVKILEGRNDVKSTKSYQMKPRLLLRPQLQTENPLTSWDPSKSARYLYHTNSWVNRWKLDKISSKASILEPSTSANGGYSSPHQGKSSTQMKVLEKTRRRSKYTRRIILTLTCLVTPLVPLLGISGTRFL